MPANPISTDHEPDVESPTVTLDETPPPGSRREQSGGDGEEEEMEVLDSQLQATSASPQPDPLSALPIHYIIRSCDLQTLRTRLFRELCFYLPFLVMFCCYVLVGQLTNEWYYMNSQVAGQMLDGQLDVKESMWQDAAGSNFHSLRAFSSMKTLEEWYGWVESVALPVIWDVGIATAANRSAFPFGSRSIIGNNMPLGAVRFRTIRVRARQSESGGGCTPNPGIFDGDSVPFVQPSWRLGPGPCYPPFSMSHQSSVLNSSALRTLPEPSQMESPFTEDSDCGRGATAAALIGFVGSYPPCAGNTVDIPLNVSLDEAVDMSKALRGWLSNETMPTDFLSDTRGEMIGFGDPRLINTRLLTLEFFYFNPVYETFTSTQCLLEVSVAGELNTIVVSRNFLIWTSERAGETVYFVFFMCVVAIYTIMVPINQVQRIRSRGGSCLSLFLDGWFFLDIVNVLMFAASFLCRIVWMIWSSGCTLLSPTDRETSYRYPQELEGIAILYMLMNYFNVANVVLSFLKLIKFTELNYSMSVVLRTLAVAKSDIFGVIVVFAAVVVSYTFAGIIFFGAALPRRFSTFWRAFSSLLRMLIGDFDFESMAKVNRAVAGLYFWTFMILALFLMLSFIVGVLDSVFEDVGKRINATRKRTDKDPNKKRAGIKAKITAAWQSCKDFAASPLLGMKLLLRRFWRWMSVPDQLGLIAIAVQRHLDEQREEAVKKMMTEQSPHSPVSDWANWTLGGTGGIVNGDAFMDDSSDEDRRDGNEAALPEEHRLLSFSEVIPLVEKHLGRSASKRIDFRVVNHFWRTAIANRAHDDAEVEDVEGEALKEDLHEAVDEAVDYLFGLRGGAMQIEGLLGENSCAEGFDEVERDRARLVQDLLLNEEVCKSRLQQLSDHLTLLEEAFCWKVLSANQTTSGLREPIS